MNKQYIYSGLIALVVSVSSFGAINLLQDDTESIKPEYSLLPRFRQAIMALDNEKKNFTPFEFIRSWKSSYVPLSISNLAIPTHKEGTCPAKPGRLDLLVNFWRRIFSGHIDDSLINFTGLFIGSVEK